MKSFLSIALLTSALVLVPKTTGQEANAGRTPGKPMELSFAEPNTWWNLYFSKDNNPLQRGGGSIHAVKVLEVSESRPSWIKIAFPKTREDHLSILQPASKAQADDDISFEAALAEWEKTISEWTVMWVNLGFVVYMTKVDSNGSMKK
jgi:hypothetical protein